jgi:hypothetical protein
MPLPAASKLEIILRKRRQKVGHVHCFAALLPLLQRLKSLLRRELASNSYDGLQVRTLWMPR